MDAADYGMLGGDAATRREKRTWPEFMAVYKEAWARERRLPKWAAQVERQSQGRRRRKIDGNKRRRIYERDGFACVKCGRDERKYLSLDHRVPISKGGTNADENLQTMCQTCNTKKGDQMPEAVAA